MARKPKRNDEAYKKLGYAEDLLLGSCHSTDNDSQNILHFKTVWEWIPSTSWIDNGFDEITQISFWEIWRLNKDRAVYEEHRRSFIGLGFHLACFIRILMISSELKLQLSHTTR